MGNKKKEGNHPNLAAKRREKWDLILTEFNETNIEERPLPWSLKKLQDLRNRMVAKTAEGVSDSDLIKY